MKKKRKAKTMLAWAGIYNDEISFSTIDDGYGGYGRGYRPSPELFLTRKVARTRFKDVRRVKITEVVK